ncbi:MAG: PQQ-like beta-propeller repeat protein [Anaerolineae bacterium]|nr:PQQ-like beta-propeller repeat protein [Anaerolineae bacterium]
MYAAKRPFTKPILFLLILAAFVLAACAGQEQTQNWPGMTADGDKVYVAYGPAVLAYDTATQSADWTYPSGEERSQLQFDAAPSVLNGRVVFGDYGQATSMINPRQIVSVYGVSDPPGSPSDWKNSDLAEDKIIAPLLQEGDRAFFATGDSKVFAIDATNGQALWPAPFVAANPIWGPMAYADGNLYVAGMDGNIYAIDGEAGTENGRWQTESSFPGGLTLDGDMLYAGGLDNFLHAFDRTVSDTEEVWVFTAETGIWGAPIVVDEQVIFGDMNGNVYAVAAATGELLWQASAPGPIVTSPAVSDGVIYIASEGDPGSREQQWFLTAFNSEDGTQVWQQSPVAGIYTTPVVIGDSVIGVLFGTTTEDLLIAYDKTSGIQQWTYSPTSASEK